MLVYLLLPSVLLNKLCTSVAIRDFSITCGIDVINQNLYHCAYLILSVHIISTRIDGVCRIPLSTCNFDMDISLTSISLLNFEISSYCVGLMLSIKSSTILHIRSAVYRLCSAGLMVSCKYRFPSVILIWVYLFLSSLLLNTLCTSVAIRDFSILSGIHLINRKL